MRRALAGLESFARRRGYLFAALAVGVATIAFLPARPYLASEQWGWPYLLIVGLIAGTAGVGPAFIAALLAFLSWNFVFIEPYYTLHVARSGDVVHLVAFLVVAVSAGLQTGRLRDSREAAHQQELRTAALYRLSSGMAGGTEPEAMAELVDAEVVRVLGADGARVWTRSPDDEGPLAVLRAPSGCGPDEASRQVVEAFYRSSAGDGAPASVGDDTLLRLEASAGTEGVLQVCGVSAMSHEDRLFAASIAHVSATYLENRHMQQLAMRASAAEEAERLRTALVSSVSHELKTPVSSLTATVTDLLGRPEPPAPDQLRGGLEAMAEDLSRLDRSIGNLLDLSRLEAQAWLPRPDSFEAGELIGAVVSDLSRSVRERVVYDVSDRSLPLRADFVQTSRALRHVVDNALEYSTGQVTIGAGSPDSHTIELWVADTGPGIPPAERGKVFEKFYRGRAGAMSASSTGLGLSLAKEILTANGGMIRIEDNRPRGARVVLSFPRVEEQPL